MKMNDKLNTLAMAAGKSDPTDVYDLEYVMVEERRAVASDGHCMYVVDCQDHGETMDVKPGVPCAPVELPVAIPAPAIQKAFKNAPKKCTRMALNNSVAIQADESTVSLCANDMESFDTVSIKRHDAYFPDVDAFINSVAGADKTTFALSRANLKKLVKMVKSQDSATLAKVEFEVVDGDNHITVKFSGITGYLMPMVG